MYLSHLPPLLIAMAVSAPIVAAAKKSAQPTICVRSTELSGLDPGSMDQLRAAVEIGLAKHEVRVALVDTKRGSRGSCSPRGARLNKGALFLDLKALRIGPLLQLSVAFYRPGKRAPVVERSWSPKTTALLPSKELSDVLKKGALLAHRLAGSVPPREVVTDQPVVTAKTPKAPPPTVEGTVSSTDSEMADPGGEGAEVEAVETIEESPTLFWASIVTMGVGAAGLSVGAAFGIKALVHKDRASDTSTPGSQLEIPRMQESQKIANWSLLVGGTVASAGFVMWLFSDSGTPATVVVGGTHDSCLVALVGRF